MRLYNHETPLAIPVRVWRQRGQRVVAIVGSPFRFRRRWHVTANHSYCLQWRSGDNRRAEVPVGITTCRCKLLRTLARRVAQRGVSAILRAAGGVSI